jgi:hypothetical protein
MDPRLRSRIGDALLVAGCLVAVWMVFLATGSNTAPLALSLPTPSLAPLPVEPAASPVADRTSGSQQKDGGQKVDRTVPTAAVLGGSWFADGADGLVGATTHRSGGSSPSPAPTTPPRPSPQPSPPGPSPTPTPTPSPTDTQSPSPTDTESPSPTDTESPVDTTQGLIEAVACVLGRSC